MVQGPEETVGIILQPGFTVGTLEPGVAAGNTDKKISKLVLGTLFPCTEDLDLICCMAGMQEKHGMQNWKDGKDLEDYGRTIWSKKPEECCRVVVNCYFRFQTVSLCFTVFFSFFF